MKSLHICQDNFNSLLARKSRYLAKRERVTWLEKGERSNKYFLNLIHAQSHNSHIAELFASDGNLMSNNNDKVEIAYQFYSNLYKSNPSESPNRLFSTFDIPFVAEKDLDCLKTPLTSADLTQALKKCGNTAPGPDIYWI